MNLYGTELSHFTRKVRLLVDHYGIACDFIDVGNVAEDEQKNFAKNPLMKVPVLVDGEKWVLDSDNIASYLVNKVDDSDRFQVLTRDLFALNARAIMNGIMAEEVKVLLAKRTGLPTEDYAFFDKAIHSINNGLAWLKSHASRFDSAGPKYMEMHLVCMWDHLSYYGTVPLDYNNLETIVAKVSASPLIQRSSPLTTPP